MPADVWFGFRVVNTFPFSKMMEGAAEELFTFVKEDTGFIDSLSFAIFVETNFSND